MLRRLVLIVAVGTLLAVTIVGCGAEQEQAPEEEAAAPEDTPTEETPIAEETPVVEQTIVEEETQVVEQTAPDEVVSVGGFTVEGPDGVETTVPEVTAERQEVQSYLQQVRPIIEDTVRDVSDLIQADVGLENGNLAFDVEVASLEEARASVRDGLERLRGLDPPEDLEPIHQQLIETYEEALPAYNEIIEAAESGDPQRISAAVSENLPRIERFSAQTRAILQDLEQAADAQQQ